MQPHASFAERETTMEARVDVLAIALDFAAVFQMADGLRASEPNARG